MANSYFRIVSTADADPDGVDMVHTLCSELDEFHHVFPLVFLHQQRARLRTEEYNRAGIRNQVLYEDD